MLVHQRVLVGIPVQSIAESFFLGTADSTFSRFALLQADFFSPQSERRWSDQTSLFEPSGISHLDPFGRKKKHTEVWCNKYDTCDGLTNFTESQDDWPRLLAYIGLVVGTTIPICFFCWHCHVKERRKRLGSCLQVWAPQATVFGYPR